MDSYRPPSQAIQKPEQWNQPVQGVIPSQSPHPLFQANYGRPEVLPPNFGAPPNIAGESLAYAMGPPVSVPQTHVVEQMYDTGMGIYIIYIYIYIYI